MTDTKPIDLGWLREDFRLHDERALYARIIGRLGDAPPTLASVVQLKFESCAGATALVSAALLVVALVASRVTPEPIAGRPADSPASLLTKAAQGEHVAAAEAYLVMRGL